MLSFLASHVRRHSQCEHCRAVPEFYTSSLQLIRDALRLEVLGVVDHSPSAEEAEPLAI